MILSAGFRRLFAGARNTARKIGAIHRESGRVSGNPRSSLPSGGLAEVTYRNDNSVSVQVPWLRERFSFAWRENNLGMLQLFLKGGPMMWPLLVTSLVALTTVLERIFFSVRETMRRNPKAVAEILRQIEIGNVQGAITAGRNSQDFVARVLLFGLEHKDVSYSGAVLQSANKSCADSIAGSPCWTPLSRWPRWRGSSAP